MDKTRMRTGVLATLILLLAITMGCSKLTPEAYEQLRVGMSYDEVLGILGKPDDCQSALGLKECTWGNPSKHIHVKFGGNSVVFYSSKGI